MTKGIMTKLGELYLLANEEECNGGYEAGEAYSDFVNSIWEVLEAHLGDRYAELLEDFESDLRDYEDIEEAFSCNPWAKEVDRLTK